MSAAATAERFQAAVLAGDPAAVVTLMADDVVVHGPVTRRMAFRGRDEVRELFEVLIGHIDEVRYTGSFGDGDRHVLTVEGRRGRHRYEEAIVLRADAAGQIAELRIYVRPLPGTVAMAAAFGPALARARGMPVRGAALWLMLLPVRAMLLRGDALGVRLLSGRRRRPGA